MKTCIITGASSGIGKATVIEVAKSEIYTNLILIARNTKELSYICNLVKKNINCEYIEFDLTELDKIPEMVEKIYLKYGEIHGLMNIAGYTSPNPLLNETIEEFEKTYKINVFAPFLLMKSCVKYMRKNDETSKIINIASTAAITPRPGWLSYASSKAAILSMSQTLSEELAEYDIKVYSISPGRCATPLREKLAPNEDQSKIMQPEDVAEIIVNLASEKERVLDGQNIIIRKKVL